MTGQRKMPFCTLTGPPSTPRPRNPTRKHFHSLARLDVLELRRDVLGERHPDTIRSMASLAATYHQQGRSGEAEEIKVKVLELRRDVLGDRHPDTIESMA